MRTGTDFERESAARSHRCVSQAICLIVGLCAFLASGTVQAALDGTLSSPPSAVDLSGEGDADWAHWGRSTSNSFDHKASGGSQISDLTVVGTQPRRRFGSALVSYAWNDGTPTSSDGGTATGIYFPGKGNGYEITVPADTTARTLRVYLSVWKARGRIEASLSDSSAPAYVGFVENLSGVTTRVVTLDYSAAAGGQSLTFRFVSETNSGNVTVQSATLSGGDGGPKSDAYSNLVTFGDSLSDTGNVYTLSGNLEPASPPYYQGRYSDGPVWSEQLAAELGIPLVTMAHGGALTGAGSNSGPYPGLLAQVEQYLQENGDALDSSALYAIWVGANDLLGLQSADATAQAAIATSISNITSAIQQLAAQGASRFLVLNLPDLGLIPRARSGQSNLPAAELTRLTDDFNASLSAAVGATAELVDVASLHRQVTNDPSVYGFSNVSEACLAQSCQNPEQFLFFDDLHPTNAGHGVLKNVVINALD